MFTMPDRWKLSLELFSAEVMVWILPLVVISIAIGWVVGRGHVLRQINSRIVRERDQVLNSLQLVIQGAEQLTSNVDSHNSELASVEKSVCEVLVDNVSYSLQQQLLRHIAEVIEANKRMEDDLIVTKYRLDIQAQELDRTRKEARTDGLSAVANRKAFDEALEFSIANLKRNETAFAILMTDVDHFKRINDTHGHKAGDCVVMQLGKVFQTLIRPEDFIARYGGDEFAMIFPGLSIEAAEVAANYIRTVVQQTNFVYGGDVAQLAVTLSMGLALADSQDSARTVLARADKALYVSKESGRNRLTVYRHDGSAPAADLLIDASA